MVGKPEKKKKKPLGKHRLVRKIILKWGGMVWN
jgi:hypothetical protein